MGYCTWKLGTHAAAGSQREVISLEDTGRTGRKKTGTGKLNMRNVESMNRASEWWTKCT